MKNDRFIDGIYNYCDYWCDRCAFTRRCRNFVMGRELEKEADGEEPSDDATQESFWNELADELREVSLFSHADDWSDDIEFDLDYMPDLEHEDGGDLLPSTVDKHPVSKLAYSYMKKVRVWLKSAEGDLKAVAKGLLEAAESRFDDTDYEEQARQIGDMIEVISWYHTLLPPKVSRVLSCVLDRVESQGVIEELSGMTDDSSLKDANASGKLVLVCIQRSANAWVKMREILPQREDDILELLVILGRLKCGIHANVPGAESFVRSGFDDPVGSRRKTEIQ